MTKAKVVDPNDIRCYDQYTLSNLDGVYQKDKLLNKIRDNAKMQVDYVENINKSWAKTGILFVEDKAATKALRESVEARKKANKASKELKDSQGA